MPSATVSRWSVSPSCRIECSEGRLVRSVGHAGDERAVDLEDVDRELAEVAERGVAGPEVVDREPHAEGLEAAQGRHRRVGVLDQDALGDLEDEAGRVEPGLGQDRRDLGDEAGLGDLAAGHVDAHRERPARRRGVPRARLAAGLAAAPTARAATISPVSSATGMNSIGATTPALRMSPAQERLDADDLARRQVHDRLVEHDELVALEGPLEVALEREPGERGRVHARLEDLDAVLAVALGHVHRDVGVAQQLVGRLVARRQHRDPDAGVDEELLAALRERRLERGQQPLGDHGRRRRRGRVLDQDRELVAAHPGERVAVAERATQPLGDARPGARRPRRGRGCR